MFDIPDILDRTSFKAEIIRNGAAIAVTRPAIPAYFVNNHGDMLDQLIDSNKSDFNDYDKIATSVAVTRATTGKGNNKQTLIYSAPNGLRFSNTKFNGNVGPLSKDLSPEWMLFQEEHKNGFKSDHWVLHFHVLVAGSIERIIPAKDEVDDDFFSRFEGMKVTKATPDSVTSMKE